MKNKFIKKFLTFFLTLTAAVSLSGCQEFADGFKSGWNNFTEEVGKGAKGAIDWFNNEGKNGIIDAYNNVKDGAVWVYNETVSFTTETYARIKDAVDEKVEEAKEFFTQLSADNVKGYTDFEDLEPYSDAKSEQAATIFLSDYLKSYGYDCVYNGSAFYQNSLYGGLIFSENGQTIDCGEGTNPVSSCGFIQLVSKNYRGEILNDAKVGEGVFAYSYDEEGNLEGKYVVDSCCSVDRIALVYEDTYIKYDLLNNYVMALSFAPYVERDLDTNYQTFRFISGDDETPDSLELINDRYANTYEDCAYSCPQEFERAVEASNAVSDMIESSPDTITNVAVFDGDMISRICEYSVNGYQSIKNFFVSTLGNVKINGSPLVKLDENGMTHVLDSEDAADSVRMAKGLTTSIASGMVAVTTSMAITATVAFSVKAGMYAVPFIVITTGTCAVIYNVSNMLEGTQDVYYGAKGDKTESQNPVLNAFKECIGNNEVATLVYHIWGISNSVITGLMNPSNGVTHALAFAKSNGLNKFSTAGLVVRTVLVELAKLVITAGGATVVYKLVDTVAYTLTKSQSFSHLLSFGSSIVAAMLIHNGLESLDRKLNLSGFYRGTYKDPYGVLHYYDDNGKDYRIDDSITPNDTFTKDGIKYQTDGEGRTISVDGKVKINTEGRKPILDSMSKVGQGSQLPTDDRGHIVGDQLGGSNGLENLVPQDSTLNRGAYKALENELAAAAKAGKDVRYSIELLYPDGSRRPSSYIYNYFIDGIKSIRTFFNQFI